MCHGGKLIGLNKVSIFIILLSLPQTLLAQFRAYPKNPFGHQYFIGPTGFAQAPQKRHFQVFQGILAQHQHVQPNGRTVVWGAIPHLVRDGSSPIWWMLQNRYPKYAQKGPILNWGCMALAIRSGENAADAFAMPYTNMTFGSQNRSISVGGGVGAYFGNGNNVGEGFTRLRQLPVMVTFHGMARSGKKSCLLSENYIVMSQKKVATLSMSGFRFWGRRLAFDLGVLVAPIPSDFLGTGTRVWGVLPWLSFHFRRKDRNLKELGLEEE